MQDLHKSQEEVPDEEGEFTHGEAEEQEQEQQQQEEEEEEEEVYEERPESTGNALVRFCNLTKINYLAKLQNCFFEFERIL